MASVGVAGSAGGQVWAGEIRSVELGWLWEKNKNTRRPAANIDSHLRSLQDKYIKKTCYWRSKRQAEEESWIPSSPPPPSSTRWHRLNWPLFGQQAATFLRALTLGRWVKTHTIIPVSTTTTRPYGLVRGIFLGLLRLATQSQREVSSRSESLSSARQASRKGG